MDRDVATAFFGIAELIRAQQERIVYLRRIVAALVDFVSKNSSDPEGVLAMFREEGKKSLTAGEDAQALEKLDALSQLLRAGKHPDKPDARSEEHTSELQSLRH